MSHDPTPTQALLLFGLLARHGACPQAALMPAVAKADREALATARLIAVAKRGRGLHLTLADAGWAWAAAHLSAELPPPQRALSDMLARLGEHLARSGTTLGDVIGTRPEDDAPPVRAKAGEAGKRADAKAPAKKGPAKLKAAANSKASAASSKAAPATRKTAPTPAVLRKRIEVAYLALTGGRRNESVRLAQLRAELADLGRATLDAALGRILKGDRTASLMRHDDPRQLDQADHDAAFNPSGEPFHVIWIAS